MFYQILTLKIRILNFFLTWKLRSYHWQQMLHFFLEVTSLPGSFSMRCLPNTWSVNNQVCLPIVLLSKNDVAWKMQVVQLTTQTATQALFSETRNKLQSVAEFPFTSFPFFFTLNIKRRQNKGQDFMKLIIFTVTSTTLLRGNWHCFFEYVSVKKTVIPIVVWCSALVPGRAQAALSTIAFTSSV